MESYSKEERGVRMQAPLCDKNAVTEISADFSLPDYQPEIKRLLRVRAKPLPADQYIGAGSADFSGKMEYTVLYTGNDGAVYRMTESGEYRFGIPADFPADLDVGEGILCTADCFADSVVGRVAAPRRLTVRCRLHSRIRMYGTRILEEKVSGNGGEEIERLYGSADCAVVSVGNGEPMTLADEVICEGGTDELRVIYAEGNVFVTDAQAGSEEVACRGEVCLKLLCVHDGKGEVPFSLQRRIPFAQTVAVDGAGVNCNACADGICLGTDVTVEDGRILCEATIQLRARTMRNETINYTKDLFSTKVEGETGYADCTFPRALRCLNGNFTQSGTLSLEEAGIRPGGTPVDLTVTPIVTSLEYERGKYYLNGRCRCHLVLLYDGEAGAQEFELPFRYEADGATEPATDYSASVETVSCRVRLDGERIGVDSEIAVCLTVFGQSGCQILTEVRFGEEIPNRGAVCTVCYPGADDTLWSVAKRYHRSISDLAEQNGLPSSPSADSRDSLSGTSFLIV